MSRAAKPTVWERLLSSNEDPHAGDRSRYGARQVCESIRGDMTRLLNSRSSCFAWDPDLTELATSLTDFGVTDSTGANMLDASSREALRRNVEDAIRRYEPRLTAVRVSLPDGVDRSRRSIRLQIDARLAVGQLDDSVSFESRLEPNDRRFHVEVSSR